MGPTKYSLLHTDCLFRTGVDAYAAIDAGLRIDLCFSFIHRDGLAGAFLDAGFATSAFYLVNLCWHHTTLSKKRPKYNQRKITTYLPRPKFRRTNLPKELWPGTTDEMLHNHNHNTKQIFLKFSRNFRGRQVNQPLLLWQEGGKAVAVGGSVLL
jgi:hypothetical protein